jgi:hypothetical protein
MNSRYRNIKIFIVLIVLSLSFACSNSPKGDSSLNVTSENSNEKKYSDLQFREDFFDFGSIVQGEVVSHTFHFHNAGNGILIIKDLVPDCGCTEPKIEKKSLNPGEESYVEIIFNSKGWAGSQYKSVTLRTNSPNREKSVTIKANVVASKE